MSAIQALPVPGDGSLNVANFLFKPGVVGGFGIQLANGSQTFSTGQLMFRGSTLSPFGSVVILSPLRLFSDPTLPGAASPYAMFWDLDLAPGALVGGMITDNGNVDVTAATFIWALLSENRVYRMGANPGFAAFTLFNALPVIQNSGNFNLLNSIALNNGARYQRITTGTSTYGTIQSVSHATIMQPTVSGAVVTATVGQTGLIFQPTWDSPAGSTINFGTLIGMQCREPTNALFAASLGTRNLTAYYGLDFPNFTFFTGTQAINVVRSALNVGTNRRFLNHTGTAQSDLGGNVRMPSDFAFGVAGVFSMGASDDFAMGWLGTTNEQFVQIVTPNAAQLRLSAPAADRMDFAISTGAAGIIRFNSQVDINAPDALGGGAAATLGTIGGTGPTAAAQNEWVQILVNGNVRWIPCWA